MKLNSLQLRNFMSHSDTTLDLNGSRLASFVGSNGSGKSALAIEAIRFALFNDSRGKPDQLVKLGQTDMSVRVEFEFADATYAVTRGRSTKAGGTSRLEFAIANHPDEVGAGAPSWIPLTGDTIDRGPDCTEARIRNLLRMDANTFDTAVLLAADDDHPVNRFGKATAGERKAVLGQILGLQIYERAEARAREEARDIEGSTAADRATIGRLEAELGGRPALEVQRGLAQDLAASLEAVDRSDEAARAELATTLEGFAVAIAAGEAASREVAQRRTELEEQRTRFHRLSARKTEAETRLADAQRQIAGIPETAVADAGADREAIEANVARLERDEAQDRELERAIATNGAAVAAEQARVAADVSAHLLRLDSATRRVAELQADLAALPPITCPQCAYEWPLDQAGLGAKLLAARTAVRDFPPEPQEPIHLAVEAAKVERLRINRRELAYDPEALTAARVRLRQADAARDLARLLETLRQTVTDSTAAIEETTTELAEISEAGKTARAALADAESRAIEGASLRSRVEETRLALQNVESNLRLRAEDRRRVAGTIAQATVGLERLDRLAIERDTLAAGLADSDRKLARLRRLVAAFSVKGIPARIIESVLPELTGSANELLEQLRPGMTLDIRAQRAKADGKGIVEALDLIVQDDAGERALGLYSGGERMSVSLAIAVGLSRLVARRAGTAIRTLVIDEPDGLDADARRSFGQALRILAHQGELERCCLVSHHQDLADCGDAVYQVTKDASGSHVEQIA